MITKILHQEEGKKALQTRTRKFGGEVIRLFTKLDNRREELRVLGKQLLRSRTSVGANYREASRARSNSEFIAKIELCIQEADETQYWLELLTEECGVEEALAQPIWQETDELSSIFVTMVKNTKAHRH